MPSMTDAGNVQHQFLQHFKKLDYETVAHHVVRPVLLLEENLYDAITKLN